jgi:hypothetical protein
MTGVLLVLCESLKARHTHTHTHPHTHPHTHAPTHPHTRARARVLEAIDEKRDGRYSYAVFRNRVLTTRPEIFSFTNSQKKVCQGLGSHRPLLEMLLITVLFCVNVNEVCFVTRKVNVCRLCCLCAACFGWTDWDTQTETFVYDCKPTQP